MPLKKWKRDELIAAFRALGAEDPEGWASSQLEEGIPQLHRFAFLRALWSHVVTPGDARWLRTTIDVAKQNPDEPESAAGAALERMFAAGASPDDVLKVVWAAQSELVFAVAHQLDDPDFAVAQLPYPGDTADVAWGLFATDEDGKPKKPIEALHESVTEVIAPPKW
jgi:hypothetical protein